MVRCGYGYYAQSLVLNTDSIDEGTPFSTDNPALLINTEITVTDWVTDVKSLTAMATRKGTWLYTSGAEGEAHMGIMVEVIPMQYVEDDTTYGTATIFLKVSFYGQDMYVKDDYSQIEWKVVQHILPT